MEGALTLIGATVCHSGSVSPGPAVCGTGDCQVAPDPCVTAIWPLAFTSAIESVSGDQAGEVPAATRFAVPPLAGMTSTFEPDSNAMVRPRGDHTGFVPGS